MSASPGNAVFQIHAMPDPTLDIQKLQKSARYRVRRAFRDYYNNPCREGEILTFVEFHFLPYHGGYTLVFTERTIYLQEEENAEILNSLGTYLMQIRK